MFYEFVLFHLDVAGLTVLEDEYFVMCDTGVMCYF